MPRILVTEQDDDTNNTQASESAGLGKKRGSAGKGSDSTYSGTPES